MEQKQINDITKSEMKLFVKNLGFYKDFLSSEWLVELIKEEVVDEGFIQMYKNKGEAGSHFSLYNTNGQEFVELVEGFIDGKVKELIKDIDSVIECLELWMEDKEEREYLIKIITQFFGSFLYDNIEREWQFTYEEAITIDFIKAVDFKKETDESLSPSKCFKELIGEINE